MKTLFIAAALMLSTPAVAAECYRHDENPNWSITINDPGSDPEWIWNKDGEEIAVTTTGAGTGVPTRVAWPEGGEGARYMFYKGALILDMDVYEPVACD